MALELASLQLVSAGAVAGYWVGFTCTMLLSYTGVPLMLEQSSAVTMNVSFLTSDGFSILFAVYLFRSTLAALFYVALLFILIGMIVYNLAEHGYSLPDMWDLLRTCKLKPQLQPQTEQFTEQTDCDPHADRDTGTDATVHVKSTCTWHAQSNPPDIDIDIDHDRDEFAIEALDLDLNRAAATPVLVRVYVPDTEMLRIPDAVDSQI